MQRVEPTKPRYEGPRHSPCLMKLSPYKKEHIEIRIYPRMRRDSEGEWVRFDEIDLIQSGEYEDAQRRKRTGGIR